MIWLYIGLSILIIFSLPSTAFFFIFIGIFRRTKAPSLDEISLDNTQYEQYKDQVCKAIKDFRKESGKDVYIQSDDNLKLYAKYYDRNSNKLVIFVHGYRATPYSNFSIIAKTFLERGYSLLTPHQRSHGKSEGRFTTCGYKEKNDLEKWIHWALENTTCDNIILYGMSMGSTTVAYVAPILTNPRIKLLVLDCGFNCFYDELSDNMLKHRFIGKSTLSCINLYVKTLLKADIKNPSMKESLTKTNLPILFIHGEDDDIVPIQVTLNNYNNYQGPKDLITSPKAKHSSAILYGGEIAIERFYHFIDKYIN